MKWQNSEIEITDLGDRLEVMVRKSSDTLQKVIVAIIVTLTIYVCWRSSQVLGFVAALLILFSALNSFRRGNEARLTVTSQGFVAEGNIERTFTDKVEVSVTDIYGFGYFAGGEGDPSGLYAFRPLGYSCIVPGIDKDACLQIKQAVEAKFPAMEFGQQPLSGLFSGPEIITLGLSSDASRSSNHQIADTNDSVS